MMNGLKSQRKNDNHKQHIFSRHIIHAQGSAGHPEAQEKEVQHQNNRCFGK